jgi:hypothetical protein
LNIPEVRQLAQQFQLEHWLHQVVCEVRRVHKELAEMTDHKVQQVLTVLPEQLDHKDKPAHLDQPVLPVLRGKPVHKDQLV